MSHLERVVVLVDMDCFYCQVEENLAPRLRGKPIAVVQYNALYNTVLGGKIIAVNYPARDRGVVRHVRAKDAKEKCPEIQLVQVPNIRGKADLAKYREAGKRVAEVLQSFTTLLERASVDEAYLDITDSVNNRMKYVDKIHPNQLQNTHIIGHENVEHFFNSIYSDGFMNESDIKLAWGAVIAEEIRAAVLKNTGYKCSAGIAHNKILAKLAAGIHKPNQQTILPHSGVPILFEDMPVRKVRSLGGKFGNNLSEKLGIKNMGELYKYSEQELANHFDEKTANRLYNIARGIDNDPVTIRLVSKSIGCCKAFPGRAALTNHENVKHWLKELAIEISERLEKDLEENNRKGKQMVINFSQEVNKKDVSGSRSHALNSYDADRIMQGAYEVVKKNCLRSDNSFCIKFLGISVGKFVDVKNVTSIASFFNKCNSDEVNISRNNIISEETKIVKNVPSIASFFDRNNEEVNIGRNKIGEETKIVKNVPSIASFFNKSNEVNVSRNNIAGEEMKIVKNVTSIASFLNKSSEVSMSCNNITVEEPKIIKNVTSIASYFNRSNDEVNISRNNIIGEEPNSSTSFFTNYINSNKHSNSINSKSADIGENSCDNKIKDEAVQEQLSHHKKWTSDQRMEEIKTTLHQANINVMPSCSYQNNCSFKCDNDSTQLSNKENVSDFQSKDIEYTNNLKAAEGSSNLQISSQVVGTNDLKRKYVEALKEIESDNIESLNDLNCGGIEDPKNMKFNKVGGSNGLKCKDFNDLTDRRGLNDFKCRNIEGQKDIKFNKAGGSNNFICRDFEDTKNIKFNKVEVEDFERRMDIKSNNIKDSDDLRRRHIDGPIDFKSNNIEDSNDLKCTNIKSNSVEGSYNEDSNDSITGELQPQENLDTSSFFNKYLEKMCSPTERNFDTSQNLEFNSNIDEEIESLTQSGDNRESITPTYNTINDLYNTGEGNNSNIQQENINDGCELCSECNKRIPYDDYVSHMDYHFALKIVRSEADLYKPVKIEKPMSPKKGSKRKSAHIDNCAKLTSFLVPKGKIKDDSVPQEICSECNKSIPLEDFASHVDYHVAKRIHLEINNFNTGGSKSSVKKVDDKSCGSKPFVKKVDDKSCGSKSFVKKVDDKSCGSKSFVKKVDDKSCRKSKVKDKKETGRSIASFFKPA